MTSTVTASPGPSPTFTPTVSCLFTPVDGTKIATYAEHDIPGGQCFRLLPAINVSFGPLDVSIIGLHIPEITLIAHPVDFCYTQFLLDISLAGINLWDWLVLIFDIILVSWVINIIRATG
jgi:hypothetical protein